MHKMEKGLGENFKIARTEPSELGEVVNSIGDSDSTRHGWTPLQEQESNFVASDYLTERPGTICLININWRLDKIVRCGRGF